MEMYRQHRPSLCSLLSLPAIGSLVLHSLHVEAYIPAVAVNDTSGLNFTDSSTIAIAWQDISGVYSGAVSYQLRADVLTGGTTSGALVHFTEASMGQNLTTTTPWIAYISCDANETGASMEWGEPISATPPVLAYEVDIFTLARDRGAVSALLYTATAASCLLNSEYITDFEKPLDVFATKTLQVARVIDNQFIQHTNTTFYTYNGTLLNDSWVQTSKTALISSGSDVNASLAGAVLDYKTFLVGTLTARNSTGQATSTDIPGSSESSSSSGNKTIPSSMIVLYVIVGVIGSVFILMLVLGARRARRHPERYGRREEGNEQGRQTTASGLAQAILDTFPVIKFRRGDRGIEGAQPKRIESEQNLRSIVLPVLKTAAIDLASPSADSTTNRQSVAMRSLRTDETGSFHSALEAHDDTSEKSRGPSRLGMYGSAGESSTSRQASGTDLQEAAKTQQGEERPSDQCPICLLDFEEGDDIRVLPCEREHSYHQACIDPWLLQVSASCPLCRKDFNNPSPPSTSTHADPSGTPSSATQPPTQGGFAKYLAFMRRERRSDRMRHPTRTSASVRTESTNGGMAFGFGSGSRHGEGEQGGPGGY